MTFSRGIMEISYSMPVYHIETPLPFIAPPLLIGMHPVNFLQCMGFKQKPHKENCIPVGCGPPTCCSYLPACTLLGGGVYSKELPGPRGSAWSQGGSAPGGSGLGGDPPSRRLLLRAVRIPLECTLICAHSITYLQIFFS